MAARVKPTAGRRGVLQTTTDDKEQNNTTPTLCVGGLVIIFSHISLLMRPNRDRMVVSLFALQQQTVDRCAVFCDFTIQQLTVGNLSRF